MSIPGVLRAAARERPGAVFLREAPGAVTLRELDEHVDRLAAGLAAHGVGAGDRVGVALPNGAAWIGLLVATTRLGAVLVTLNVRYRGSELEHMLADSGARLVVTVPESGGTDLVALYDELRPRLPDLEHVVTDVDTLVGDAPVPEHERGEDDPAVILYTSGTTGTPKGAVLTHGSLLASARAEAGHLGLTPSDRFLATMPFTHVGGLTCTLLTALVAGSEVVLTPGFSPAGALRDITTHGVTVFAGVPTMWTLLLAEMARAGVGTLETVRYAVAGGSNVEPALCAAITTAAPHARVVNLYGLSETSGAAVMSALDDDAATVATTLGVPLAGVEARIVDPVEGTDADEGELWLRGPSVAAGYRNVPDVATFRPDGWLATGDVVARVRGDHLALRGRLKEMFISGGYNVYPVEVENVLGAHSGVAMVAGVGAPDDTHGEVGHYFVVRTPDGDVTADELVALAADRLANYKVPRVVEFVDELPLTPAGKIQKAVLRQRVQKGS
ncbi:long-chain-fatty-acid--CoA ligase [Actinomycetospora sp. NBRC 106375]|uniref:class I adenylate-forming enzyme family protein n=1 Tax=Actinomycetospora sp. NBRC 106375 TaxID=3032207 RepID=UPI0024A016A0|nr:AMP-binding protein [Actinomycetospora sp. NBRC 106375]GLZ44898.1 long-chain-fatty-acid--CoA ligase [Actinomycetospora sp. NBRC 106375]